MKTLHDENKMLLNSIHKLENENMELKEIALAGLGKVSTEYKEKKLKSKKNLVNKLRARLDERETELTELKKRERQFEVHRRMLQETTKKFNAMRKDFSNCQYNLMRSRLECRALEARITHADADHKRASESELALLEDRQVVSTEILYLRETVTAMKEEQRRHMLQKRLDDGGTTVQSDVLYIRRIAIRRSLGKHCS